MDFNIKAFGINYYVVKVVYKTLLTNNISVLIYLYNIYNITSIINVEQNT